MNTNSDSIRLKEMIEEIKKNIPRSKLIKFFEEPVQRAYNLSHSLLSLSSTVDKLNYGPLITPIIEPYSSGSN